MISAEVILGMIIDGIDWYISSYFVVVKKVELFWFKLSIERAVSSRQHDGRAEWLFKTLDMPSGVIIEWKSAVETHWCGSWAESDAVPQDT